MIFKAIVIGLLAWQLIQLVRKKREKPNDPVYIVIPPDQKSPLKQREPPPSYYALPSN